jgi:probable rRNA maturation factor
MSVVDVLVEGIEPPSWLSAVEPFATKVLDRLDRGNWELSLLLCGDPLIRDLNREYRGKDEPTDVLSFEQGDGFPQLPDPEGGFIAGDIAISLPAMERNAESFGVPAGEELKRLIIHGILHLGGMDHADNSPEQEMLVLQESVLAELSKERIF